MQEVYYTKINQKGVVYIDSETKKPIPDKPIIKKFYNTVQYFLTVNYEAEAKIFFQEKQKNSKINYTDYISYEWVKKARVKFDECLEFEEFDNEDLYGRLRTNYAIFLNGCGRYLEALEILNELLDFHEIDFAPAVGVRCKILLEYSSSGVIVNEGNRQVLHKHIFQTLIKLMGDEKNVLSIRETCGDNMINSLNSCVKDILNGYGPNSQKFLGEEIPTYTNIWNYDYTNQFVNECRRLRFSFLNEQIFSSDCTSHTYDDLNINTTKFKDLKLLSLFNEIKESYITSRFLIFNSEIAGAHDTNEINKLSDFFDLKNQLEKSYSLNTGLLKQGLKASFDNFDKILRLIAHILYPEWEDKQLEKITIDNKKLWTGHDGFKAEVVKEDNKYLMALYDIHLDFIEGGKYRKLSRMRHASTHYFTDVDYHSSVKTLKLSQSAIFYLLSWMNTRNYDD